MANSGVQIDTREVRDLSRRLRGLSKDAQKDLQKELVKITESLAVHVKTKMPSKSGRARASVKARKVSAGMRLAYGGTKAPHAPWLDFGGSTKVPGAGGRVQRPFIKEGRYVWPTVGERSDEIGRDVEAAMQSVARKHGLDVRR